MNLPVGMVGYGEATNLRAPVLLFPARNSDDTFDC